MPCPAVPSLKERPPFQYFMKPDALVLVGCTPAVHLKRGSRHGADLLHRKLELRWNIAGDRERGRRAICLLGEQTWGKGKQAGHKEDASPNRLVVHK